jgi:hypothetical protein
MYLSLLLLLLLFLLLLEKEDVCVSIDIGITTHLTHSSAHAVFSSLSPSLSQLNNSIVYINHPRGYKSQYATCLIDEVDGYPSWKFGNGKVQGGEMELIEIAKLSGYDNIKKKGGGLPFDASLETGVPPLGGASCQ